MYINLLFFLNLKKLHMKKYFKKILFKKLEKFEVKVAVRTISFCT